MALEEGVVLDQRLRRREVLDGVVRLHRLHKGRPDLGGKAAALHLNAVDIRHGDVALRVANPYGGGQVWGIATEPGVVKI